MFDIINDDGVVDVWYN